ARALRRSGGAAAGGGVEPSGGANRLALGRLQRALGDQQFRGEAVVELDPRRAPAPAGDQRTRRRLGPGMEERGAAAIVEHAEPAERGGGSVLAPQAAGS